MRLQTPFLLLAAALALHAGKDSGLIPKAQRKDVSAFAFSDGRKTHTLAEHKGKVVIVDFWTTWCPPCRESLPELAAIQRQQDKLPIVVLPVNMDEEGWSKATPFIQRNKQVLKDFQAYIAASGKQGPGVLGTVDAFPTTFLVDADGRLAWFWSGYGQGTVIERANAILAELPEPAPKP
ncbi:MAG: TlpA family protein disulfide reductase [Holophagaceae bacterium]|nr:TlpA family protein disulfide reductase [Holophagaceae bacterium]